MGFFSIDRSNYEALRELCDKTEKAAIEYDKLDMKTASQVKAGEKFIAKARASMDRGTLTGTKTLDNIRQLIDLCTLYTTAVKLLNESPEESERRINEIRAEEAAELQRNENAAKGDIWDSLDK
jgi:predicted PilT family ATPase